MQPIFNNNIFGFSIWVVLTNFLKKLKYTHRVRQLIIIMKGILMEIKTKIVSIGLVLGLGGFGSVQAAKEIKKGSQEKNITATQVLSDPGFGVDAKIGFVDTFQVMGECQQGQKARKDLEKKREELSSDIQQDEKKIQQAMTEYKSKVTTLSEEARGKEKKKLIKMERDYKNKIQESEDELKLDMQKKTERLARESDEGIIKMAQQEKLDVVFDKMTGRAVYVSDEFDFTNKAISIVDKNYEIKLAQSKKVQLQPSAVRLAVNQ